eukprot:4111670-Prorocentrum_lima.AAC.1
MTSSLVGSEMCIRDSQRHPYLHGPHLPAAEPVPLPRCPNSTPWNPGTVSYTHLTLPTICSV